MSETTGEAPLTEEHLRAAIEWAKTAPEVRLGGSSRLYDQATWDCGTARCLHGAAHLIARGHPAGRGPLPWDYADLDPIRRAAAMGVLHHPLGTPEELAAALDGRAIVEERAGR